VVVLTNSNGSNRLKVKFFLPIFSLSFRLRCNSSNIRFTRSSLSIHISITLHCRIDETDPRSETVRGQSDDSRSKVHSAMRQAGTDLPVPLSPRRRFWPMQKVMVPEYRDRETGKRGISGCQLRQQVIPQRARLSH